MKKVESPFMLEAYDRFMEEKKSKEVRLGEFLSWGFQ